MEAYTSMSEFEDESRKLLPENTNEYILSYPERGESYKENEKAFRRIRLRQPVMRDVSKRNLATTILGEPVSLPIGVSPSGYQRLYWPDGEVSTARGAAFKNTCMILSCYSTVSIPEVARASPCLKWMQIFIYKDRTGTRQMVEAAERCGYKALVLTLDTTVVPWGRPPKVLEMPSHLSAAVLSAAKITSGSECDVVGDTIDDGITWADFDWLKGITKLPIVVKGIMGADDAKMAVQHGAAGIIVSNHGGRQLDTVSSTIEALPGVVSAVEGKLEVYLDGGVRYGSDVLKALALGARAVFIGRPAIWGLACGGADGVARVLTIIERQLHDAMALSGSTSVKDVTTSVILGTSSNL